MSAPVIDIPRGKLFIAGGRAQLQFNSSAKPRWQGRFTRGQRFADSEVLRHSEPYIPLLTGFLIKSGILGTEIGSGLVQWIARHAKPNYYKARKIGSQTGPLRGPHWFARMKKVKGTEILAGARRISGRS